MGELKQVHQRGAPKEMSGPTTPLTLYDRYSSLAYGVILKIIPEPEVAQNVLIDLFASPQLRSTDGVPTTGEIIRLARSKALAARSLSDGLTLSSGMLPPAHDTMNTAKNVFDLSFCQGYTPEAIAEKLQISPSNVLKAFYTYFKHLRSS